MILFVSNQFLIETTGCILITKFCINAHLPKYLLTEISIRSNGLSLRYLKPKYSITQ